MPWAVLSGDLTRPLALGLLRPGEAVTLSLADEGEEEEEILQWSWNMVSFAGVGTGDEDGDGGWERGVSP